MKKYKIIYALKNLLLFSAICHMIIVIPLAFMRRNMLIVNWFNIVELDFLFPNIIFGWLSQILSFIVIISITAFFYFFKK